MTNFSTVMRQAVSSLVWKSVEYRSFTSKFKWTYDLFSVDSVIRTAIPELPGAEGKTEKEDKKQMGLTSTQFYGTMQQGKRPCNSRSKTGQRLIFSYPRLRGVSVYSAPRLWQLLAAERQGTVA